ncbi:MAG: ATP-binding protein [Cyanobacteria bacterium P01_G01_bin.54]
MSSPYTELRQAVIPLAEVLSQATSTSSSTPDFPTPIHLNPELSASHPLNQLSKTLHLNLAQRDLLLLSLTLELFPQYQGACALIQGSSQLPYITYSLAKTLLASFDWSLINAENPLYRWQILTPKTEHGLMYSALLLDPYIFRYQLGQANLDPELSHLVHPVPLCDSAIEQLPNTQTALRQAQLFNFPPTHPNPSNPHLLLHGQDPHSRSHIAAALSAQHQRPLYSLPLSNLPSDATQLHRFQLRWERQALLTQSVLLIEIDGLTQDDRTTKTRLTRLIRNCRTPLILSHDQNLTVPKRLIAPLELYPLTPQDRQKLWRQHLGNRATTLNGTLPQIAQQFPLSPQRIATLAAQLPISETPEGLTAQLWQACRQSARPHLEDLAQRIQTPLQWKDLVLPEKQTQRLRELVATVRQRDRVLQDWGFASKAARGLGTVALFAGASGTGKTTAAELIAKDLELDCYRIDLSNIVNKYIGETEKNLKRVFDAAEGSGAMLLFDEADAVFGQRGAVKEARDRYANQEVSYLLQRLETFPGIAILTTNLKKSIDEAFKRRLRYIIDFPEPDQAHRARMWQRVFPVGVPLAELDYQKLAALNVTGGNIRNIALMGAFLAAEAGTAVTMPILVQAMTVELEKLGRQMNPVEAQVLKGAPGLPRLR